MQGRKNSRKGHSALASGPRTSKSRVVPEWWGGQKQKEICKKKKSNRGEETEQERVKCRGGVLDKNKTNDHKRGAGRGPGRKRNKKSRSKSRTSRSRGHGEREGKRGPGAKKETRKKKKRPGLSLKSRTSAKAKRKETGKQTGREDKERVDPEKGEKRGRLARRKKKTIYWKNLPCRAVRVA